MSNRECLDRAFERDPDRTLWILELAMETLFLEEKYDEAIELGKRALIVTPDVHKTALLYRIGRCHVRLADRSLMKPNLQAARRYYRTAGALERLEPYEAGINLAWVSWKLKEYTRAVKECRRAIKTQPEHFWGHYLLALLLADSALVSRVGADGVREARQALRDARRLKKRNGPEYLYQTVEACLLAVRRRPDLARARRCLRRAAKLARGRVSGPLSKTTHFPMEDHYQPGYALRAFRTARVKSFIQKRLPDLRGRIEKRIPAKV